MDTKTAVAALLSADNGELVCYVCKQPMPLSTQLAQSFVACVARSELIPQDTVLEHARHDTCKKPELKATQAIIATQKTRNVLIKIGCKCEILCPHGKDTGYTHTTTLADMATHVKKCMCRRWRCPVDSHCDIIDEEGGTRALYEHLRTEHATESALEMPAILERVFFDAHTAHNHVMQCYNNIIMQGRDEANDEYEQKLSELDAVFKDMNDSQIKIPYALTRRIFKLTRPEECGMQMLLFLQRCIQNNEVSLDPMITGVRKPVLTHHNFREVVPNCMYFAFSSLATTSVYVVRCRCDLERDNTDFIHFFLRFDIRLLHADGDLKTKRCEQIGLNITPSHPKGRDSVFDTAFAHAPDLPLDMTADWALYPTHLVDSNHAEEQIAVVNSNDLFNAEKCEMSGHEYEWKRLATFHTVHHRILRYRRIQFLTRALRN